MNLSLVDYCFPLSKIVSFGHSLNICVGESGDRLIRAGKY